MFKTLFAACVSALAVAGASAAPTNDAEFLPSVFTRAVTEHFYLVGNLSGLAKVDGVKLGSLPEKNTYVGWGLPYGQKETLWGYDNSTLRIHAGSNSKGQALMLAAFPQPDGSAAVKPAIEGEDLNGGTFLECEVIASELFCVSEPNGINQNDFTPTDYKSDGNYELAIDRSRTLLVRLYVVSP